MRGPSYVKEGLYNSPPRIQGPQTSDNKTAAPPCMDAENHNRCESVWKVGKVEIRIWYRGF